MDLGTKFVGALPFPDFRYWVSMLFPNNTCMAYEVDIVVGEDYSLDDPLADQIFDSAWSYMAKSVVYLLDGHSMNTDGSSSNAISMGNFVYSP